MRSLVRAVTNRAPIPHIARSSGLFSTALAPADPVTYMQAYGSVGILHAIVSRLAESVAGAEWCLYRTDRAGERVEVEDHQALRVWEKPNPFTTCQELVESGQQHFELTGESWFVVGRNPGSPIPLELWNVRPDRMTVVPSRTDFIAGYLYTSPDGETVPLAVSDVIFIRHPNPVDAYRGMGAVQTVLHHIDGEKYSAEWNRNFFLNGAEPGGIIEVDKRLSDGEFDEMTQRWKEQHQGVANAHRVAVLEQAHYIDRKFSQKDMQFTELSNLAGEKIREAFGFPRPLLGTVTDVNRANAEAAEVVFARWLVTPRLERIKQALNNDFLPLFGTAAAGLEFDYESPVPEDEAAENAERDSKVKAAIDLVGAGFDALEVLDWLELPALTHSAPSPGGPPPPGGGAVPPPAAPAPAILPEDFARVVLAITGGREPRTGHGGHRHTVGDPDDGEPWRAVAAPPDPPAGIRPTLPDGAGPDLGPVQADWERALADLLDGWAPLNAAQKEQLLDQVEAAVAAGDILGLASLTVGSQPVAELVQAAMERTAAAAAERVVVEAAAQDVTVHARVPETHRVAATAQVTAVLLGGVLAQSAAREALRIWAPGMPPAQVRSGVSEHLDSLTTAQPAAAFGSVLTQAQHDGRVGTMVAGPSAALYADEVLDSNTCGPCRAINRKWLGNSDDPLKPWEATYPVQGFVGCLGRSRCRGMTVAVWRGGSDWKKWVELPEQRTG